MQSQCLMKKFLLIIFIFIFIGTGLWLWTEMKNPKKQVETYTLLTKVIQEANQEKEKEPLSLQLFFSSQTQFSLAAEMREVKKDEPDIHQEIHYAISELIKGPIDIGLVPTIPPDTKLRSFYLDKNGVGYADFSQEIVQNFPGGSWRELMTIYSIVNTVIKNFPQVHRVKLLINGQELETLRGHISIRRAFSLNETLDHDHQTELISFNNVMKKIIP